MWRPTPKLPVTRTRSGVGGARHRDIELIAPRSLYREGRVNQLNFAINRVFRGAGNARIQPRFELHNALNSAPILAINGRYGPAWQQVRSVLAPRPSEVRVANRFLRNGLRASETQSSESIVYSASLSLCGVLRRS
jgi:hypothetical protein